MRKKERLESADSLIQAFVLVLPYSDYRAKTLPTWQSAFVQLLETLADVHRAPSRCCERPALREMHLQRALEYVR